jgi:hypothetical protein
VVWKDGVPQDASSRKMDAVGQLRATFEAASGFGLSDEEIWGTVVEVCERVPSGAPLEESLDRLTAALAGRILER